MTLIVTMSPDKSGKGDWCDRVQVAELLQEILYYNPYIVFKEKGRRNTQEDLYIAFGTTESGRYLFVLFILKIGKKALILTARDMTKSERRYYERKKDSARI